MPATMFVTSGYVGQDREFWWDEIEALVLTHELPSSLSLRTTQGSIDLALEDRGGETEPRWTVISPDPPGGRYRLYRELHRLLKTLGPQERESTLMRLRESAGSTGKARETHRPMTEAEVKKLAESEVINVGSHGVTHSMFSRLTPDELSREMTESKARLESMVQRPVLTFSYPFGSKVDIDGRSKKEAAACGYSLAVANYPGWVDIFTHRFALPRFLVRNWDRNTFLSKMEGWSQALP